MVSLNYQYAFYAFYNDFQQAGTIAQKHNFLQKSTPSKIYCYPVTEINNIVQILVKISLLPYIFQEQA